MASFKRITFGRIEDLVEDASSKLEERKPVSISTSRYPSLLIRAPFGLRDRLMEYIRTKSLKIGDFNIEEDSTRETDAEYNPLNLQEIDQVLFDSRTYLVVDGLSVQGRLYEEK